LVSGGEGDFNIRQWDLSTNTLRRQLTGHTSRINAFLVLSFGLLLSAAGNEINLWQPPSYGYVATLNSGTVSDTITSLALLQNDWFAVGSTNFNIEVYDGSITFQHTMVGPAAVVSLATLSDGNLASSYADGTIIIWNPTANTQVKTYSIGATDMRLMPAGTSLIYNNGFRIIQTLDTNTDQITVLTGSSHDSAINAAAISTTSPLFATVGDESRCVVRNRSSLAGIFRTESSRLLAVTFLPDGRVAIAGCPAAIRIFRP
jgi:WD40 repeat protein